MKDLRQIPQYAAYMQSIGWQVDQINNNYIFIKHFPFLGNFIKIQRPENLSETFLKKVISKHKPFQILLEPLTIKHLPTGKSGQSLIINPCAPYLPSKTLVLDLSQSENNLLSQMHPKTRYNINLAKRKGIEIKTISDINKFTAFWDNSRFSYTKIIFSQAREIKALYSAFGNAAHLVCAFHNEKLVSGILMLTTQSTAYYMYAASTKSGKSLHAPTLNTWGSILLAKRLGKKIYDFEGIYDNRFPIKSWQGFTKYKKSFGGEEVEFPGAFKKTFLKNFRG